MERFSQELSRRKESLTLSLSLQHALHRRQLAQRILRLARARLQAEVMARNRSIPIPSDSVQPTASLAHNRTFGPARDPQALLRDLMYGDGSGLSSRPGKESSERFGVSDVEDGSED